MKCWRIAACMLCVWLFTPTALGAVQRFAVIVGNDRGHGADVKLRYAESDAAKMAKVLRELGGFRPADMVLLQGENAETVRSTLIAVNDRLRAAQALPDTQTLLFVYYSGHADARALHLGSSRLELRELAQLVRGSAAQVRLLIVDACRSGTLTRAKGGKIVPPFALPDSAFRGEGLAFLTASSENEDAQESDELRGSFFTHALVSGLLGAADENGNGEVTLEEAYAHAYEATLRATSATFAGTQHPNFRYEVQGQGSLVLTRPAAAQTRRAEVVFPPGIAFLVMANNEAGAVLGEVGARDHSRRMSLPPGRFFVRGRGSDYLLEGMLSVGAGQVRRVATSSLERVEYARLVRKGRRVLAMSSAAELGLSVRSVLPNASTPCAGALLGYQLQLESLGFAARLGACTSEFENRTVDARTDEYSVSLGATRTWDVARLSVFAGAGLGAALVHQSFETYADAPSRLSLSPLGYLTVGGTYSVARRAYVGLDLRLEGHLVKLQRTSFTDSELRASAAVRGSSVAGVQF
ncbi:MAG TPA: caspase family protein [Polyangiaceae bacterium]